MAINPSVEEALQSSAPKNACFHCGLVNPSRSQWKLIIDGVERTMCCPGCQAASELIINSGLTDYYRYREIAEAKGESVASIINEELEKLAYDYLDLPGVQKLFVEKVSTEISEASIVISGLRCAACVWLLESFLDQQHGIVETKVNLSNQMAFIRFDPGLMTVSRIFVLIHRLGYQAIPYKPNAIELVYRQEKRTKLKQLGVAGIIFMQVMMVSIALYAGEFQGMLDSYHTLFRYASMLLVAPVVIYSARPFFYGAYIDIKTGSPGMDLPVALAIGGAYLFSVFNTVRGIGDTYFDSVSMFTFFLLLGKFLEFQARYHSHRSANQLLSVFPVHATRLASAADPEIESTHQQQVVLVEELNPGDSVLVSMGAIIPIDGILLDDRALVDQSALSGESTPVECAINDRVLAGSINLEGPIRIRVSSIVSDAVVSKIIRLSERAAQGKPEIAYIADIIARRFVIFVLCVAALTGLWWGLYEPARAFSVVLSVLVISCPCALSLATPAALTVATTALRRNGFLVSKGHVIERLASVKEVVFDKTGTLTLGRLNIEQVTVMGDYSQAKCLAIAAGLEQGIVHPVARAFNGCPVEPVTDRKSVLGRGVMGSVNGHLFRLGKPSFALPEQVTRLPAGPGMWLLLADDAGPVAWFRLLDQLRADSVMGVSCLQKLNVAVHMLTGDTAAVAEQAGCELGIKSIASDVLPEDKMTFIQRLQNQQPEVMMIGDGINDIAALSAATTSVTMSDASDFVQAKTDAVLLSNRVLDIARAVEFARKARRIIRQNLGWALIYNLVALPLAICGLVAPWFAALGMSFSSLLVVCNAWRLRDLES